MQRRTIIGGFDMSLLLKDKPAPKQVTQETAESAASIRQSKQDKIDKLIAIRELDRHPQVLKTILSEYGLTSFWKQINSDDRHAVITPLAVNRMLNFYEGAAPMLSYKEIQQGLLISALSAAPVCDRDNMSIPTANTFLPCFYIIGSVDLSKYKIRNLSDEAKSEVICILNRFARRPISDRAIDGVALLTYLKDAWKMWVCSDDERLLDFMGRAKTRSLELPAHGLRTNTLASVIGRYEASTAADRHELTLFNTSWGRTKSIRYNNPARVKTMVASFS